MSSAPPIPEVSLITSWCGPPPAFASRKEIALAGLEGSLVEGVRLLDLYFLSPEDVEWYRRCMKPRPKKKLNDPEEFAASLSSGDLDRIAAKLTWVLSERYGGPLVGRRPRINAFATFFPNVSLPDSIKRKQPGNSNRQTTVQALRNTLYLAGKLGCCCVEIVGGAGAPGPDLDIPDSPDEYRTRHRRSLAQSLCELYDLTDHANPLVHFKDRPERIPCVSLELEPGLSFLLNSKKEFTDLLKMMRGKVFKKLPGYALAMRKTKLNIDIAHAFILGLEVKEIREEKELFSRVAHMHISDHAAHHGRGGVHAADLPPGTFHWFGEYREWLKLALDLTRQGNAFSRSVAIELEAINDLAAVLGAIATVRRWLRLVAKNAKKHRGEEHQLIEGALLVADIGNSTQHLLQRGRSKQRRTTSTLAGCQRLEKHVDELCHKTLGKGGSVMSFTGDGFIALFEERQFEDPRSAAEAAREAAKMIAKDVTGLPKLTARIALHWGKVYIPTSGRLANQIIGPDVVYATRTCDWLAKTVEAGQPPDRRAALLGATVDFIRKLSGPKIPEQRQSGPRVLTIPKEWTSWGRPVELKGLDPILIYYRYLPLSTPKHRDVEGRG